MWAETVLLQEIAEKGGSMLKAEKELAGRMKLMEAAQERKRARGAVPVCVRPERMRWQPSSERDIWRETSGKWRSCMPQREKPSKLRRKQSKTARRYVQHS